VAAAIELTRLVLCCQPEKVLSRIVAVMLPAGLFSGKSPMYTPSVAVMPTPSSQLPAMVTMGDAS